MTHPLAHIIRGISVRSVTGSTEHVVAGITADSRQVRPGWLFVAVRGSQVDGHQFISKAVAAGAIAVVAEHLPESLPCCGIRVADSARALGELAAAWYGSPSGGFDLVGITGTNGKTTVATLLHQLFTRLGYVCGLVGTVEHRIGSQVFPSTHTTPDPVALQALFRRMADAGCTHVFMEASSHAIHQQRIAGCHFRGAVFTNLTHDHLDYHGSFAAYRDAKKSLFDNLPKTAFALINTDDRNGAVMVQNTKAKTYTYALKKPTDFKAKVLEKNLSGLEMIVDDAPVHARLTGLFNAYNLLAAYGVALLLEEQPQPVLTILSSLQGAEGRFDCIPHPTLKEAIGIVDYAHTPDALENVLQTIRDMKKSNGRVITIVGCGGDRDREKRPVMAQTAANLSDQVILTSDNPRTESPAAILADMEAGLDALQQQKTLVIENREQAIRTACRLQQAGDIVLLAGKGHEKYQEVDGVKYPFDDKIILLREMHASPIAAKT